MAMLGSLLMFAGGGIAYVDALLFATGACTQAGLNPVDVNILSTWQQIVLFLFPFATNIIIVHTSLVALRLIWFQRRFQHVVKSAKLRVWNTRSMGQTNNNDLEERGVNANQIRVLLASGAPMRHDDANNQKDHMANSLIEDDDDDHFVLPDRRDSIKIVNGGFEESGNEPKSSSNGDISTPVPMDGRDIRFGDLPQPQRHGRTTDDSDHINPVERSNTYHALTNADNVEKPEDLGRRTITIENAPDPKNQPKMRVKRRTSQLADFARANTLEQAIQSAFGRRRDGSPSSRRSTATQQTLPYISFQPTVGRNSQFNNLTQIQKEELGGIEYRSLRLLFLILMAYLTFYYLLGLFCFVPWIYRSSYYTAVLADQNVNSGWWAAFTASTSLNDVGFTLTSNSMISFQEAVFVLLVSGFLIVAGNTGFPCFLRLWIWISFKIIPKRFEMRDELAFLLDHPRRCFTLLFPSRATWWLFAILVGFNLIDLFFFLVLDIGDAEINLIPVGYRFVIGLFQAVSTRTAGLSAIDLNILHPAVLISYMVMMYVSVFPVAISMRRTNVYEEKSLGIYADDDEEENQTSFVGTHIRRQLSFDIWYIFLGVFLICIVEGSQISDVTKIGFTEFSVLFECVSAYGTVGLSLGYPGYNTSFCGQFHVVSKLIICALEVCQVTSKSDF